MMTLRQRIFIGSGIAVAILVVIILAVMVISRSGQDNTQQTGQQGSGNVTTVPSVPSGLQGTQTDIREIIPRDQSSTPTFSTEPQPERLAKQVSGIFVERFQSYSSTNKQEHLSRVEELVTPAMWTWVSTQEIDQTGEYEGVTTEVVASRIISISETSAEVEVDVQQRISTATSVETVQRQATVDLVADSETGGWLVSGFYWVE
jgi:hypothetical protein